MGTPTNLKYRELPTTSIHKCLNQLQSETSLITVIIALTRGHPRPLALTTMRTPSLTTDQYVRNLLSSCEANLDPSASQSNMTVPRSSQLSLVSPDNTDSGSLRQLPPPSSQRVPDTLQQQRQAAVHRVQLGRVQEASQRLNRKLVMCQEWEDPWWSADRIVEYETPGPDPLVNDEFDDPDAEEALLEAERLTLQSPFQSPTESRFERLARRQTHELSHNTSAPTNSKGSQFPLFASDRVGLGGRHATFYLHTLKADVTGHMATLLNSAKLLEQSTTSLESAMRMEDIISMLFLTSRENSKQKTFTVSALDKPAQGRLGAALVRLIATFCQCRELPITRGTTSANMVTWSQAISTDRLLEGLTHLVTTCGQAAWHLQIKASFLRTLKNIHQEIGACSTTPSRTPPTTCSDSTKPSRTCLTSPPEGSSYTGTVTPRSESGYWGLYRMESKRSSSPPTVEPRTPKKCRQLTD